MENHNEQIIEEKIRSFVAKKSKLADISELDKSTKVFSSGLLDSLHFVELMLFLEKEFKIEFSNNTEVNMKTMDSISQIVQKTLAALKEIKNT